MNLRRATEYVAASVAMVGAPLVFLPIRHLIEGKPGTVAFAEVVVVLLVATTWGTGPALVASAAGVLAWDYFFLPPYFAIKVTNLSLEDAALLLAFLIASFIVGQLSARVRRRAEEANLRRQQLERLYLDLERENSERRRAEEALLKAQEDLELRVRERTAELKSTNERLELQIAERKRSEIVLAQRSEELTRSNAELEQFAYVASHDLQEPLRMVASYLQLLEQRYRAKLDTDAKEFIGFAVDGAKRMQVLINDLLAYSRVGTKGEAFRPNDCGAVVETVLSNLRMAIEESGAEITCGPLPVVMADATQLAQLFQNLIGNAMKFHRQGIPRIHIEAEPQSGFWHFSVRDNGIGIAPEYFERIFILFQRLHGRGDYPGTGIGLAICKKIVERHGGRIWVESEPEKGSIFSFSMRRIEGDKR